MSEKEIEAPEDMKPCPFCGESHLLVSDKFEVIPDDDGPGRCSTVVFCESCSSEFELDWHSKSFLEMVWNKRSEVEPETLNKDDALKIASAYMSATVGLRRDGDAYKLLMRSFSYLESLKYPGEE